MNLRTIDCPAMNGIRCIALAALMAGSASPCRADPGHEIRIEDLNKQISENPALPDLYFQRSVNYREVNRPADARADLEKIGRASCRERV